jgi:enoyl-CoA hydratase/carnithine racemase
MELLTALAKRVLRLTLNRPQKRNALTAALCAEIVDQVDGAQGNPDVGAILIGANGGAFCAGMDLNEAGRGGAELDAIHERLFTMGQRSLKPIVVAVNGAALGGGLGLVAQGHVVACSDEAAFGLPEVKVGLFPFFIYRSVAAAIGSRNTLQAALTGKLFYLEEALRWGLVHKTFSALALQERVELMARELAKASPEAITRGLEYVQRARGVSDVEAGKIALELRRRVMAGADFKEGVAAFEGKREPRWPSMPPGFYEQD